MSIRLRPLPVKRIQYDRFHRLSYSRPAVGYRDEMGVVKCAVSIIKTGDIGHYLEQYRRLQVAYNYQKTGQQWLAVYSPTPRSQLCVASSTMSRVADASKEVLGCKVKAEVRHTGITKR